MRPATKYLTILLPALLLLAGCYHMRITAAPLETVSFDTTLSREKASAAIARLLEEDGFPIEERNSDGIYTGKKQFATETGISQPVEGRGYYCGLRVILSQKESGANITMEPQGLEIRTNYVEPMEGGVQGLTRTYAYENYPGMFELRFVGQELRRVMTLLRRNLQ